MSTVNKNGENIAVVCRRDFFLKKRKQQPNIIGKLTKNSTESADNMKKMKDKM